MADWQTVSLGDALTFQRGFDITKDEQRDGPYPVISSSGPKTTHAEFKVRGPGVIIGRKGSLGTVFYSDSDYWPHDTTLWIKDFHGNHPRFAYYFLQTMGFERLDAGASNPSLNRNHIHTIPVRFPPLPVQRRIAGILSAYDELMENSQRRIRLLEAMARTLYREWFVHFRFPGHEKHPRVASPLGDIPQGWEGRFGGLASIERDGINPFEFPEEEFEHFSLPAFDNGRQPAIELGATILSGKYCIDDSTVLLSKLNPRIPRIWLPVPSGQRRAITSTEFLGLKPQPGVTREFIYAKCCSDEFAGQFGSLAIGTSTSHQRVKPENLLAMPSTVPDRKTIARFSKLVSPMLTVCQRLRSQIQNLRRTRDLLLPRLLSGQVELASSSELRQVVAQRKSQR